MQHPINLDQEIIRLYRGGLNYTQIGHKLSIDRHKIPHILRNHNESIRIPFQGTKAEWSKQYEKTPKGFLMRAYRNMQSRVRGIQRQKAHLYQGLPILSREEFYKWAWEDYNFWRLYKIWVQAKYDRKLTPSVNRVDSYRGYVLGNIEWLTFSVNSSLGGSSPKRRSPKRNNIQEILQHVQA